jgi:hypothetical protein
MTFSARIGSTPGQKKGHYSLNFLRKELNTGMNVPELRKFILRMVTYVEPQF